MPSGYLKKLSSSCIGSYSCVSFRLWKYLRKGSAGRNRLLNKRPIVRGIVMNPVDHPHGGGEGRKSQPKLPLTPWGKPGKWVKTSKKIKLKSL
jgi:large subunit ribosomal protein L2